jgi:WG containing repeat
VRNGKKLGLIGLDGKTIFDAIYDNLEPTNLPHVFRLLQNKNVGLLDTSWTIRTGPIHESISDFNEFGIAVIKDRRGSAFVNVKDFKTSKFYTYVSDYNEFGVSTVRNEANLYGLIDTNLNVVVQPKYASIGVFNQLGLAPACHPDGKCGFIKYDGKEQIKANYESVSNFNAFGLAVAKTLVEGCNGGNSACKADVIIDRNGNTVVPVTDDGIRRKFQYQLTDSLRDGRYIVVKVMENDVSLAASYLLINKNDLQLITGTPYQTITANDVHGNFRVEDKGKWGILDSTGKVVTKLIHQEIKRVNDDYYATKNDKGKWGYLNKKGKPQIPFDYEEVRNYRFGFAPVSQGRGKWGLINRFNAKIVPCVFKSVVLNAAETKFEVTDENNVVFIINERGECETNCAKLDELRAKANRN